MISPLTSSAQHISTPGRCHYWSALRPIAVTASRCRSIVRPALHDAGNSSSQCQEHTPRQQQQQQEQEHQALVTACRSSNSSSHHQEVGRPIAMELLATHTTLLAVAALAFYLLPLEPAAAADLHQPASLFDLAEDEEGLLSNAVQYARYFITVLLGTGYVMVQPLVAAFKKPVTAIVAIVGIAGGAFVLKLTLDAMLGIQEPFAYEPGNVVPYN